MEIRSGRMVHLGYGKYWRADGIRGLVPVEEDRGPGRRTRVYVEGQSEPIVASRTEEAILGDMGRERGAADVDELREGVEDFLERLRGLSPVIRRMLRNEENMDVQAWIDRLSELVGGPDPAEEQEDLFPGV